MKINGHGQAAIFQKGHFEKLISATEGANHKLIFQIAYFTCARMGEVCKLKTSDVYQENGKPLASITYPKRSTKCKKTKQVPISDKLQNHLRLYWFESSPKYDDFLFSGGKLGSHLQFQSADDAFRRAVVSAKLEGMGYSTHSFRRSGATELGNQGIALPIIQEITGHSSLDSLRRYIHVTQDQVKNAIATL
jgi:integrase/recombinase XerD